MVRRHVEEVIHLADVAPDLARRRRDAAVQEDPDDLDRVRRVDLVQSAVEVLDAGRLVGGADVAVRHRPLRGGLDPERAHLVVRARAARERGVAEVRVGVEVGGVAGAVRARMERHGLAHRHVDIGGLRAWDGVAAIQPGLLQHLGGRTTMEAHPDARRARRDELLAQRGPVGGRAAPRLHLADEEPIFEFRVFVGLARLPQLAPMRPITGARFGIPCTHASDASSSGERSAWWVEATDTRPPGAGSRSSRGSPPPSHPVNSALPIVTTAIRNFFAIGSRNTLPLSSSDSGVTMFFLLLWLWPRPAPGATASPGAGVGLPGGCWKAFGSSSNPRRRPAGPASAGAG